MMLSLDPGCREYEVSGLKPQEIAMYDLAWKHNRDGFGFAGLCDLWMKEVSPHITLAQINRVWDRLCEYSFFRTNRYYEYCGRNYEGVNDYVPHI